MSQLYICTVEVRIIVMGENAAEAYKTALEHYDDDDTAPVEVHVRAANRNMFTKDELRSLPWGLHCRDEDGQSCEHSVADILDQQDGR